MTEGKVPTACGSQLLALDFPAGLRAKSVRWALEGLALALALALRWRRRDMAPLPPMESCGVGKGKAVESLSVVRDGACCRASDITASLVLAGD